MIDKKEVKKKVQDRLSEEYGCGVLLHSRQILVTIEVLTEMFNEELEKHEHSYLHVEYL